MAPTPTVEEDQSLRDYPFSIDLGGAVDRWAFLTWLAQALDDPDYFVEWEYVRGFEGALPYLRQIPFDRVIANTR